MARFGQTMECGTRIRRRWDTEEDAKVLKQDLEVKDVAFNKARQHGGAAVTNHKRSVFVSDLITTQARVVDCEDALRLFPTTPEGIPCRRKARYGSANANSSFALLLGSSRESCEFGLPGLERRQMQFAATTGKINTSQTPDGRRCHSSPDCCQVGCGE